MNQNSKKILVIEDEKPLAQALEFKLKHEGFVVVNVPNGEIALPLIENEQFSLIICDLIMPKVDGFKVLEFVKNKNIKSPVVILTNLSQPEDEALARGLGASEFYIKSNTPISIIIERIKEKLAN